MFDFLTKTANLTFEVVTAPVAVVADVVTLGGILTDRDESYTETKVEKILDSADEVLDTILED